MSFQYPYALFVLLAIPVLILIYILKNKYKEETEPSTYLWDLSEKFLKKRNPLHKFEHLLSLIVQIVTITGLAFSLAHPTFTLTGMSDNIVFVLDASASMATVDSNQKKSYFELAKEGILEQAKAAAKGSEFSLIYASSEPRTVCKSVSNIDQLSIFLDTLQVSSSSASLESSMVEAQKLFSDGVANKCVLATDKNIKEENAQNVSIFTVGKAVDNYAIINCEYHYENKTNDVTNETQNYLVINTKVISYKSDVKLKIQFSYGPSSDRKVVGGQQYSYDVKAGAETAITTEVLNQNKTYNDLTDFTARITNEDALMDDNAFVIYSKGDNSNTAVRIYSNNPFYLQSAFNALDYRGIKKIKYDTFKPASYAPDPNFSGIYIFDGFSPDVLPEKGTFWFFGSPTEVKGSGFLPQGEKTTEESFSGVFTNNSDSLLYNQFTDEVRTDSSVVLKKYIRYSITGDFTTILKDGNAVSNAPLIFGGKNDNGNREVVFAFDIHDSELPLQYNFLALIKNFLNYSNPELLSQFNYNIDETMTLSVPDESKRVTVTTPGETLEYVDTNSDGLASYQLVQSGIYTFHLEYDDETLNKDFKVFVSFPTEESDTSFKEDNSKFYSLVVTDSVVKGDGIFDDILPIVIVAAVFFILDWGLYVHEQY